MVGMFLLVIAVPSLFLLLLVYSVETNVSGTEFDPITWQIRSFSYRRDPFTGRQLTGVLHDSSNSTPNWPTIGSFLKTANSKPTSARWDLVRISRGSTRINAPGPAAILDSYMTARDPNGDYFWASWGKTSRKKASILWPAVQELILHELYSDLPLLFEKAPVDMSDESFRQEIQETMLALLRTRAFESQTAGNPSRAIDLARLGLNYGDDPELIRILDSLNRTGTGIP